MLSKLCAGFLTPSATLSSTVQTEHMNRRDIVHLQFREFIDFLQSCEHKGPILNFTCPWEGANESPSIDITFGEATDEHAHVYLSLHFCNALIKYMMVSDENSVSEESHVR